MKHKLKQNTNIAYVTIPSIVTDQLLISNQLKFNDTAVPLTNCTRFRHGDLRMLYVRDNFIVPINHIPVNLKGQVFVLTEDFPEVAEFTGFGLVGTIVMIDGNSGKYAHLTPSIRNDGIISIGEDMNTAVFNVIFTMLQSNAQPKQPERISGNNNTVIRGSGNSVTSSVQISVDDGAVAIKQTGWGEGSNTIAVGKRAVAIGGNVYGSINTG